MREARNIEQSRERKKKSNFKAKKVGKETLVSSQPLEV